MHKPILLFVTAAIIILAGWLTFFDHSRYGTHADGFRCGEVKSISTFYTATAYYTSSQPLHGQIPRVGTCPYDIYQAKTYALDLWISAVLLGGITLREIQKSRNKQ